MNGLHDRSAEKRNTTVAVRTKTDGQELERAGVVYLLQKTHGEWQIATIVIHEANDALRPE